MPTEERKAIARHALRLGFEQDHEEHVDSDVDISFDAAEVVDAIDQVDELTSDLPEALERVQRQAKILKSNRELEEKIEDKERKISNVEDKTSDELKVIEGAKILDAYVVGLVEKLEIGNLYEFAFTTFRNQPTRKHGYLLTTETSFESSGLFEMRVKKMREVRTKLRREFGGFEQSWPLFIEVKGYERSREKVEKLREKKQELEDEANRIRRFKNPRRNRTYSTRNSGKDRTEERLVKSIDLLSKAFEHSYDKNINKLEIKRGEEEVEKKTSNKEYATTGSVSPRGIAEEAEVRILRDTITEKRLIVWARPKVRDTLSQSFDASTAIGPFRRFEEEDGLLFKTADAKWRVLHFWSPSREVHVWRVTNRRTREVRKSDNSSQYPEIDSLLTSTSGLSRSQELEDHLWNGMDYSDARHVVLAAGWMPTDDANRSGFRASRLAEEKNWREVRTCAGTGAAPCRFEFLGPVGNRLVLITVGESDDPGLESWAVE